MTKMRSSGLKGPGAQAGAMLIEALVAILLFTCGIVAVLGMQSVSIVQVSQAKYRTDASYLANQILGKMWADRANVANYLAANTGPRASWDATVAATLPNGTGTIVQGAGGKVSVTIQWRAPNEAINHSYVAAADIRSTLDP